MKHGCQHKIAKCVGISDVHVSLIISGKRRPSWRIAKKMSAATQTTPELWLDGTSDEIRQRLSQAFPNNKQEDDNRVE